MQLRLRLALALFLYSLLIGYLRTTCWKDPTSKFFQAQRAHVPKYSAHRIEQAIRYADLVAVTQPDQRSGATSTPALCIGVSSVRRDGVSYLKSTLGSLQHGLSAEERASLRFVVLLAHTNQTEHPDYGQAWLVNMADMLPSYGHDPERLSLATTLETKHAHASKSKFDYSVVLEECEGTGAPYTLMIEDDVVFLDGWRHRVMKALKVATAQSWEAGHTDFLYLRLFYYEGLLGWRLESWPTYLGSSLAFIGGVMCLLVARRYILTARPYLTHPTLWLATLVFTPLLIATFFAAGRNCVHPQPSGVHLMHKYACCGQGLVFPRGTIVHKLLPLFRSDRESEVPTDSFIENYADATGALRWALTPVVMQHVGGRSSHDTFRGAYGDMAPSYIWNFAFEANDARILAEEHAQVNSQAL